MEMEKEHDRMFKKTRTVINKKGEAISKVDKKLNKMRNTPELIKRRHNLAADLDAEVERLCDQERKQLTEIFRYERSVYTKVAAGLQPIIFCEFAMFRDIEQLTQVMENMKKIAIDPFEESKNDFEEISFLDTSDEQYFFATPQSTPAGSSMGSRNNSIRSVNSFSRSSSVARSNMDDVESFRSRNNSVSSYQVKHFLNKLFDLQRFCSSIREGQKNAR